MDNASLRSVVPYALGLALRLRSMFMRARLLYYRGPVNLGLTCGRALPFC